MGLSLYGLLGYSLKILLLDNFADTERKFHARFESINDSLRIDGDEHAVEGGDTVFDSGNLLMTCLTGLMRAFLLAVGLGKVQPNVAIVAKYDINVAG